MKKLIALMLSLAMVVSLSACGGGNSSTTAATSEETQATDATETASKAESGDSQATDAETESESEAEIQMETLEAADGITVSSHPWFKGEYVIYQADGEGAEKKTAKDTFVYGNSSAIKGADPNTFQNEFNWCEQVYDVLIQKDLDGGDEYLPGLATEWGYDDDGNFVMTLRENVKFHDGTTLDADDVIFTFQRIAGNTVNKCCKTMNKIDFDKTTADGLTLTIVFKEPVGSWLNDISSGYCSIMSKEYCEANPEATFLDSDAGSGPYMISETVTGISQTMTAFEDYWGGAPEVKTVIYKLYKDYSVMAIDFKNGDLDAAFNVTYDVVEDFLDGEMPGATLYQVPSRSVYILIAARGDVAFSDVRLRQALAYCIDYSKLVPAIYQNAALGQLPVSPFPTGTKYSTDNGVMEYDPDKAIELLAECGYSTSNPCHVSLMTTNSPAASKCATIVQQYGSLVGFDIEITEVDSSGSNSIVNSTEVPCQYDLVMFTKSYDTGSPEAFLSDKVMYSGSDDVSGLLGIEDETFNELAEKAAKSIDEEERAELYAEIQDMWYENFWTIQAVSANAMVLTQSYVDEMNFLSGYHPQLPSVSFK